MKTLEFKIQINASPEKVWEALWNDANYRKWAAVFYDGSYAESDWNEGSGIRFLAPNGDGMFSMIEKKILNQLMLFKHLGEIKDGVETNSNWGEAREQYTLVSNAGGTELTVNLDTVEEMTEYFAGVFPKALDVVKQIAEA